MHEINRMRMMAGLTIIQKYEQKSYSDQELTEDVLPVDAVDGEDVTYDKKTLKARHRACKSALTHLNQALFQFKKVEGDDNEGDISQILGEVANIVDAKGSTGLAAYVEKCSSDIRKCEACDADKKADKKTEEEYEINIKHGDDYKLTNEDDEGFDKFILGLSTDDRDELVNAMEVLKRLTMSDELSESAEYMMVSDIVGADRMDEAMHYFKTSYGMSHEEDEDKPINVANGTSNGDGKQVMDSLPPTKDENPSQFRADKEEEVEVKADTNVEFKIPKDIINAMVSAIAAAKQESEKMDVRDKDAARLYRDQANAFQDLLNHLKKETVYDFKQAQVFAQTLFGPFLHKIPTNVWKFLTNGGKPRSLKSYMTPVPKKFPITGPRNTIK